MKSFTFPSSDGARTYTAVLADDGKLLCNCKGWTMRRGAAPRHCTHTKRIVADLGGTVDLRGEFVYFRTAEDPSVAANIADQRAHRDAKADRASARERLDAALDREDAAPAPMLASAMTDVVTGAAFDARYGGGAWAMEEKIDGHRCTAVVRRGTVRAFSRPRAGGTGAHVRELPAPIVEQLRTFPDGVYDGELVAPSGKAWDVVVVGARLVFVIFDVIDKQRPYAARRAELLRVLATMPATQTAVSTVVSDPPTWAGVQAIWKRGGEGVILKRIASLYRPGHRSPEWVKVKAVHAATLTITGFEAGKTGPYSKLCLRDAAGHDTTVKTLGNAMLRDVTRAPQSFIGRRVVISYQEKTPGGSYRHGIFDHFAGAGE